MKKPDQHIRQILNEATPMYQEKYWHDTQSFIMNERKKRKKRLLLWFSFLVVGIIFFGVTFLKKTEAEIMPPSSPITQAPPNNMLNSSEKELKSTFQNQTKDEGNTQNSGFQLPNVQQSEKPVLTNHHDHPIAKAESKKQENVTASLLSDTEESKSTSGILTKQQSESSLPLDESNQVEQYRQYADIVVAKLDILSFEPISDEHISPLNIVQSQVDKVSIKNSKSLPTLHYFAEIGSIFNAYPKSPQKVWLGMETSGGIGIHLHQKWMLRMGLGYMHRTGTFNVMVDHPTPTYTFEKDNRGYSLIPTQAAYMSLPVSIASTFNGWELGAGYRIFRLLGAKGKLIEYYLEPNTKQSNSWLRSSTELSSGWIETPGFRSWSSELGFFAEKRISRSFAAGFRGVWIIGGLIKEDYSKLYDFNTLDYIGNNKGGLLENNYHLSIYLRYRL